SRDAQLRSLWHARPIAANGGGAVRVGCEDALEDDGLLADARPVAELKRGAVPGQAQHPDGGAHLADVVGLAVEAAPGAGQVRPRRRVARTEWRADDVDGVDRMDLLV